MLEWLKEEENHQKEVFSIWKEKSVEAMANFHKEFPFLSCQIECYLEKDKWLDNSSMKVSYDLKFDLKPEYEHSFLNFMKNIFSEVAYDEYKDTLISIIQNTNKKMKFADLGKLIDKAQGKKYNIDNWLLFDPNYSAYEQYSVDPEMNELDGLRIMLGKYGILTNSWITILDKSRSYDIEFRLDKIELLIAPNGTEIREKSYNEKSYGFNNLPVEELKTKLKF